ncbi:amidohydrolase family protein [Dethiosulfatarculus sandiegensis]|uniref:Amidohydrolase-related domain-containing protein n=1 Tax=Dethiosulfatarculus sandiegensis TaxID=1429043 RepID=A0A0D2GA67_9BACT|nr:amidohydrolase family protein [Dethiosulfatarculus sandiegensis]KIX11777.1 hypothetical protein X474_22905 [Dethiosulfatarculus sandiegensis]
MIIDGHTHAYLSEDLEILRQRLEMLDSELASDDPNKWSLKSRGDLESLIASQEEAGVDQMVLLPVTGKKDRVSELNHWSAQAARKNPRIIPFATLHPKGEAQKDFEEAIELGLKGIKLHPFIQHFSLTDPLCHKLFDLISEASLPVLTDTLSRKGLVKAKPHIKWVMDAFKFHGVTPVQIAEMAKAHPGVKIIAAHGGCLYGWDQLDPLMKFDNIYLDISYLNGLIEPEALVALIRKKGADRVIYGTDAPWRSPLEYRRWFDGLSLSKMEKQAIQSHTLLSVLN